MTQSDKRTCITISNPIHHASKIKAAEFGVTLKAFVDSALVEKIGSDPRAQNRKKVCK